MSDGRVRSGGSGDAGLGRVASIDATARCSRSSMYPGDQATGTAIASQLLVVTRDSPDAEDLLASAGDDGEIRRLTLLFADLVDSTVLSARIGPEPYRILVGRYRDLVCAVVNRYEGHIGSIKGDGLLAVFGYPCAHENDVRRAVRAGLDIVNEVSRLREQAERCLGVDINVRVGIHRGLVFLDTTQDDVYGLAANVVARVSGLARPGAVVVSDVVAPLIRNAFELVSEPPVAVKGIDGLINHHQVLGECVEPARVTRGRLVGRQRELARLQKSWVRAQAGTLITPAVAFRGEAGIGKSRLAAAAAELAEASGAAVLELAGSPFHTDVGLHPVRTLLERRCGFGLVSDTGERLRLLAAEIAARGLDPATVVPLLAPVAGIGAEAGYEAAPAEGHKLHQLIVGAVQDYLLACLGGNPGLIIADDVHWFDKSTLEVLGSLLKAGRGRLLVVITERHGGVMPADSPIKVIDLKPLTDEQSDDLIMALDPALTAEDRAVVRDRCDGVPLYIEQVVAGFGETFGDSVVGSRVPEALYEPLFARLGASANVVRVLEAAGVIGREIDRGVLRAVCDLGDDEVDDVIDELEDSQVLEQWGIDGWRFRHELLREVAAELTPPSVARRLHGKVADTLLCGTNGDPDWRLIAGHYEHAERFDEAAAAYQRASTDARRRGALDEARSYVSHALAQLDRAQPDRDRDRRETALRLQRAALAAATEGVQSRAVAADFERCLQLRGTDLCDDELAATLTALVTFYAGRGQLRRCAQVLESLRAGIGTEARWLDSWVEGFLGIIAWLRGEFDAACSHLEMATAARAARNQDEVNAITFLPADPIAAARIYLAQAHLVRGDVDGADALLADVARDVEQLGFPQHSFMRAYLRFVESWMRMEAGQLDHAAGLAADLIDQADRDGLDIWRMIGTTQQATVRAVAAVDAGELDPTALSAHITALTGVLDTWRTVHLNVQRACFDASLARLLIAAGQSAQARERLDTALEMGRATEMCFYDVELLRLRAQTESHPDIAKADLEAACDLGRRQGATLFQLRASLDDFALRGEPALAALADAANRMPTDSAMPEMARARAILGSRPSA